MTAPRTSQLPASIADRITRMAREQGKLPDAPHNPTSRRGETTVTGGWQKGREKDAQRETRLWLLCRGYLPRNSATILAPRPEGWRGWSLHWPRNMGNPLTADWILLSRAGRACEIELKTVDGKPTPIQAALGLRVVRSMAEFIAAVEEWEETSCTPVPSTRPTD